MPMDESAITNWINAKYAHIRIPKALLTNSKFVHLSPEAILLYGAMLDRTNLSFRVGGKQYISSENEITIIFTQQQIMKLLRCKRDKARTTTRELVSSNLITLKRKHKRGPYIITVVPINWSDFPRTKKAGTIAMEKVPENPLWEGGFSGISKGDKTSPNNTDNNTEIMNKVSEIPCLVSGDAYSQLTAAYGEPCVSRVLEVIESLYLYPSNKVSIIGKQMAWAVFDEMIRSLSTKSLDFVLGKMKKAKYTEEFSDAFILDALYTAAILDL